MSDDQNDKETIKKDWDSGGEAEALFQPDELDIYCNKVTLDAYIFHGKVVDYDNIERLEYNPTDYSVAVFKKDGNVVDLGVKIQWLVRAYFSKASEVHIVQTKDGEAIDGTVVPLINLGDKG